MNEFKIEENQRRIEENYKLLLTKNTEKKSKQTPKGKEEERKTGNHVLDTVRRVRDDCCFEMLRYYR